MRKEDARVLLATIDPEGRSFRCVLDNVNNSHREQPEHLH